MSWLIAVKVPTKGKTVCAKTKFMPPWAMYVETETGSAVRLLHLSYDRNLLALAGRGCQKDSILIGINDLETFKLLFKDKPRQELVRE